MRLIRVRDRKPRLGLLCERDEIDHDRSDNSDFVTLEVDPDLLCGVTPHSNLLVEIKGNHILNGDDTLDKVTAEHRNYEVPVMLVRENSRRFMTVAHNEKTRRNDLDQIFWVENMYGY